MKPSKLFQKGSRSALIILLSLACAIALNLAVGALPASKTKFDATSMQMFDFSQQTQDVLSNLDSAVEVYWIAKTGTEDTYIQTLLERYSERSDKLQMIKKDPNADPVFVKKYYTEDVADNSLVVISGDRYQCVPYNEIFVEDIMVYLTTGEQKLTFEGEAALTGAILYVTNPDIPRIYNLTGHGEQVLTDAVSGSIKRQGMELVDLNLNTASGIPEDADGILLHGPQRDISEKEREQLSAYLKEGGRLLCILGDPSVGAEHANLDSLLAEYAIIPVAGMVGDAESNHAAQGSPALLLPDMAAHAITNPLKDARLQVVVPYAKSLKIDPVRPETLRVTELLLTSKEAFAKQGTNAAAKKEEGDLEGPFAVAAAAQEESSGARVVCIGAMYFLNEDMNTMVSGGNQDLFINALSWMCEFEDGISIHTKSLDYEKLNMDNTTADLWVILLLMIPVGCVTIGAIRFVQRKRK